MDAICLLERPRCGPGFIHRIPVAAGASSSLIHNHVEWNGIGKGFAGALHLSPSVSASPVEAADRVFSTSVERPVEKPPYAQVRGYQAETTR